MSDRDDIGAPALGVCWGLSTIALIVTIARIYTQARITRQLGLSDAMLALSTCIVLTFTSLITVQYHYGWGRHQQTLTTHQRIEALKYNSIGQTFGVLGSTFGRLSTIATMFTLFGINQKLRRVIWTLFAAQLITNGVVVVCSYAQCTNVVLLWDTSVSGSCWNADVQTYLGYAHSAFNGCTDLFLTFFPAYMIRNLQMNRWTKLGVGILLGLSILAVIAVVMKIVNLEALANRGDYTVNNTVALFTWILAEAVLLNIAASAPVLRPLYKRLMETESRNYSYEMNSHDISRSHISRNQGAIKSNDSASDKAAILNKNQSLQDNYYHITVKQSYSVTMAESRISV
ncbi:uncharacterized protein N7484_011350 [Penicillium longicatenatum]|uniref:uncharacterized protein n=1 Tax=Penicillium longicatenatum TaxID=1561947 RepID=UPI0025479962|nr:uncharacterized protein N7484_011350 [Penicillium longicatenatum]KAJ5631250.1 hypothetical protein N7484_011350 [Penicillium longicatenatum]